MKRKSVLQDERMLAQNQKIGNEAFMVLFFALLASVLLQQYVDRAPFSQYAVELVLLLASAAYVLVRSLLVGNNLFPNTEHSKFRIVIQSVVCGLVVAIVNTVLNVLQFGTPKTNGLGNTLLIAGITFLSATLAAAAVFFLVFALNAHRQAALERRLREEDDEL